MEQLQKPVMNVSQLDGNIFAVVGRVKETLRRAGQRNESNEVVDRVFKSKSYEDALAICMEYVVFSTGGNDDE